MGKVESINVSNIKGIEKHSVKEVNVVKDWGLEGDAHGGDWERQVSIFTVEALKNVPSDKEEEVLKGGYTENFTISGINPEEISIDSILKIGEAEIKIYHIGKNEYKEHGRPYIVSREGRFGKVVKGGKVKIGDKVEII